jgi:hypothetical protein
MSTITAHEVEELLGEAEPVVIEQIIETKATSNEVAQALALAESRRRGEPTSPGTSPRVEAVRAIIEQAFDEPDDREIYATD